MFPRRHWFVFLFCLGGDVVSWSIILCIRAIFGGHIFWGNGLWCVVPKDSFWCRRIADGYSGGTIGHGGWLREGFSPDTEFHEHVHVEQYEVVMLLVCIHLVGWITVAGLSGGLCWQWPIILAYYILGGLLGLVASWATAWLRGEPVYRGSSHEKSAYAQEGIEGDLNRSAELQKNRPLKEL